jgi:hypothetical protein
MESPINDVREITVKVRLPGGPPWPDEIATDLDQVQFSVWTVVGSLTSSLSNYVERNDAYHWPQEDFLSGASQILVFSEAALHHWRGGNLDRAILVLQEAQDALDELKTLLTAPT